MGARASSVKRTGGYGTSGRPLIEPSRNRASRSAWVRSIGYCDVPERTRDGALEGDRVNSASIRRRLRNLETTYALALAPEYPPLTRDEIESIEQRICAGEKFTRVQLHRIEKQSPIIDGEFLISCHQGQISGKRYIGIDLAEV
jgi:hypothetical protein